MISQLIIQQNPNCPLVNISAWEDTNRQQEWQDIHILSWNSTLKQGTFKTYELYDKKYVHLVVMNEGGFSAEVSIPVTVAPLPPPPAEDCQDAVITVNQTVLDLFNIMSEMSPFHGKVSAEEPLKNSSAQMFSAALVQTKFCPVEKMELFQDADQKLPWAQSDVVSIDASLNILLSQTNPFDSTPAFLKISNKGGFFVIIPIDIKVIDVNPSCGEYDIATNQTTLALNKGPVNIWKEVSTSSVATESTLIIPLKDLNLFEFNNTVEACHIMDLQLVIVNMSDPSAGFKPWDQETIFSFDAKLQ